jgi:hypothetical protein
LNGGEEDERSKSSLSDLVELAELPIEAVGCIAEGCFSGTAAALLILALPLYLLLH